MGGVGVTVGGIGVGVGVGSGSLGNVRLKLFFTIGRPEDMWTAVSSAWTPSRWKVTVNRLNEVSGGPTVRLV